MRDLIVVGGGPAGALAAYEAASAGLDVLILQKDTRREKPCAGGLTPKSLRALPFPVADVVRAATDTVKLAFGNRRGVTLSAAGPICVFVLRGEFDDFLRRRAIASGAEMMGVDYLDRVVVEDSGVALHCDGRVLKARFLVAADGAKSDVRRLLHPPALAPFRHGIAVEGRVSCRISGELPGMEFDFAGVERGYGWLFPKGDHINVGLYSSERKCPSLSRSALLAFCERKLGTNDITHIAGYPIGFGGAGYRPTEDRVLFAGDAAGLAEALLGEGIYGALVSGRLAGKSVAWACRARGSAGRRYRAALGELRRDLSFSDFLARRLFYPYVRTVSFRLLTSRFVAPRLVQGFAAGGTVRSSLIRGGAERPEVSGRSVGAAEARQDPAS